jgi:hypothetical protein
VMTTYHVTVTQPANPKPEDLKWGTRAVQACLSVRRDGEADQCLVVGPWPPHAPDLSTKRVLSVEAQSAYSALDAARQALGMDHGAPPGC